MALYWDSVEEIAEALLDTYPDTEPLSIRFTDLLTWVTQLNGFVDDPEDASEGKLEAIQMAWFGLYEEENED